MYCTVINAYMMHHRYQCMLSSSFSVNLLSGTSNYCNILCVDTTDTLCIDAIIGCKSDINKTGLSARITKRIIAIPKIYVYIYIYIYNRSLKQNLLK